MKLHTIVVLFSVIFICIQLGSCTTVVTTVTTTATLGTIFQANLKSLGNHTLFNGVSIITIQTNNSAKLKLFHNFLNATTFQLKYGPVPEANWSIPFDQSVSPLFFEGNITLNKTMMDYLTASSWHVYVSDVSSNVMLSGTFMNLYPAPVILVPMSWKTWATLAVLLAMLILLITDRFAAWFLMFATCVVLNLIDVLSVNDIEQGFSIDALHVVIMVVIAMEAVNRTNLLHKAAPYIFGTGTSYFWTIINLGRMVLFVALVSAFVANAALVVVFLPVIKDWCRSQGLKSGKYLMPLLHAILGGGVFTQIGNAASILIYGQAKAYSLTVPGFFEPIYIGGPLFLANLIYICTLGYWFLPNTGGMFHFLETKGKAFLTEIVIEKGYTDLVGQTLKTVLKKLNMKHLNVIEIIRKVPEKNMISSPLPMSRPGSMIPPVTPHDLPHDTVVDTEKPTETTSVVNKEEPVVQQQEQQPQPQEIHDNPEQKVTPPQTTPTPDPNGSPTSHPKDEGPGETLVDLPERPSQDLASTVAFDINNQKAKSFSIFPVKPTEIVQEGDRLIISGDISAFLKTREMKPLEKMVAFNDHLEVNQIVSPVDAKKKFLSVFNFLFLSHEGKSHDQTDIFEVVISGSNPALGKTLKESEFGQKYECSILAIKKKGYNTDEPITKNIAEMYVDYGDVMLVLSRSDFKDKWDAQTDFYVISKYHDETPDKTNRIIQIRDTKINIWWYAYLCYPLFFGALLVAGLSSVLNFGFPLSRCLLILLVVYVCTSLLTPEDLMKKIPISLILLIGFSIVVGQAIINSGLATAFGELIRLMNMPNYCVPGCILFLSISLTQFVHNDAVGAIFVPLVVGVSKTLQCDPLPLTIAAIIGANSAFLTPFGFECNMMIQGPGGYKMKDYIIFGLPTTLIYFVGGSVFIPLIWPV